MSHITQGSSAYSQVFWGSNTITPKTPARNIKTEFLLSHYTLLPILMKARVV